MKNLSRSEINCYFPLVIRVSFENRSTQLPPKAGPLLCDGLSPTSSLHLTFSPFPIRLVDTFKLHQQLNVPVQNLTAGTTRKVCVVMMLFWGWMWWWQQIEAFLCISVMFHAEHPGKFTYPAPGWTIDKHGPYRAAANVVRIVTLRARRRNLMYKLHS